jgi:glycosyltransferase involved in cell wall biosynthesis
MKTPGSSGPKVTFLTPVYNGAAFLRTCVDSVLEQTHTNWEYLIVNNCSTDETLSIAREYARRDPRIRVYDNETFVTADENHNIAFGLVSADSVYTKVVSADDWIAPECVAKLVAVGEKHPSVGLVGCYQRRSDGIVNWKGLDPSISVIRGRDVCRIALMDGLQVFGAPTSVMYRSDLVRRKRPFYPHSRPNADTDVCYEILETSDLGFVHEVLSFERVHQQQVSSDLRSFAAGDLAYLEAVLKYGAIYLGAADHRKRLETLETRYYRMLARSALRLRGPDFWRFHRRELSTIGSRLDLKRVAWSCVVEVVAELRNPAAAARTVFGYVRRVRRQSVSV